MAHVRQSIRDNVVTAGTRLSQLRAERYFAFRSPGLAPISCQRFTESETLEYTRLDQVRKSTLL